MKFYKYIIMMISFATIVGCGSPEQPLDMKSWMPEQTQQITVVGNPDEMPIESPKKLFTQQYLSEHPFWKGSPDNVEAEMNIYMMSFDLANYTATIWAFDSDDPAIIAVGVNDDGSVSTNESSVAGFEVEASIDELMEDFPLDIKITNNGDDGAVATVFAASDSEVNNDTYSKCQASENACYDIDADVIGDGAYYVAGFVQTNSEGGLSCGGQLTDYCADNKVLVEVSCNPDLLATKKYLKTYVNCVCQNGKCKKDARIKPTVIDNYEEAFMSRTPKL